MKKFLLIAALIALFILHQDIWFWRTARPLVIGFIPIGLFYHACFCVASSLIMWMLVKYAWPSHLEEIEQAGGAQAQSFRHNSEEGEAR